MKPHRPYWIPFAAAPHDFPPLESALRQPNGLLAIGGDLAPERLLAAYRLGIFPWYEETQPILWWSPEPRLVMFPEQLKVSRSLAKAMRNKDFRVTLDQAFAEVIKHCGQTVRPGQAGTWITVEMRRAYIRLHRLGHAHSVECWLDGELVGGLYGISLGKVFFGESMFSRVSDASKVAYVRLVRKLREWGYELIDCQVYTEHLASLGAVEIPRAQFRQILDTLCAQPGKDGCWDQERL
jgi:leucyl/phenylalanyl-tRNA--protein transferase